MTDKTDNAGDTNEPEDLFEHIDSLPHEVQVVLQKYESEVEDYIACKNMQHELEHLGYTFDWGLDAIPYNLRQITD